MPWRVHRFQTLTGEFELIVPIPVTRDADQLAKEASPAHLLLLLARSGVNQIVEPMRQAVTRIAGYEEGWDAIRQMPHDYVVRKLVASWRPLS